MLKEIKEFLFKSKQAKRLETLENMSNCIKDATFNISIPIVIFKYLDVTETDIQVANDMLQDLIKDLEKQFKIDYQNYINSEIEKLDNDTK